MEAVRAGVDTWSVAWRVEDDSVAWSALDSMCTVPSARGRRMGEKVAGHTVGFFPANRLAYAEGHPFGAGGELCPPRHLAAAYVHLDRALQEHGLVFDQRWAKGRASGFAGVRRLDLTADLRYEGRGDGLAVLQGVYALPVPRVQKAARTAPGGTALETVAWFGSSGRRMLARWYDKGVKEGWAPRGELIRAEDQRRFTGDARLSVDALTPATTRALFQRRFVPLWKASEGVTVGSVLRLGERVGQLVEQGVLTDAQAKAILGRLAADACGLEIQSYRTRARERALAREYGLVLAGGDDDQVEVDLHAAVSAALEAEDWYAEG